MYDMRCACTTLHFFRIHFVRWASFAWRIFRIDWLFDWLRFGFVFEFLCELGEHAKCLCWLHKNQINDKISRATRNNHLLLCVCASSVHSCHTTSYISPLAIYVFNRCFACAHTHSCRRFFANGDCKRCFLLLFFFCRSTKRMAIPKEIESTGYCGNLFKKKSAHVAWPRSFTLRGKKICEEWKTNSSRSLSATEFQMKKNSAIPFSLTMNAIQFSHILVYSFFFSFSIFIWYSYSSLALCTNAFRIIFPSKTFYNLLN